MTFLVFRSHDKVPMECDTMSAAITAACHLINSGSAVSGIKGLRGFVMERSDIEIECARRKAASKSSTRGS
jgi:hypothetical protein